MAEERVDLPMIQEKIDPEGGDTRKNTTMKIDTESSGIKVPSRYLEGPKGSCHDICKHGYGTENDFQTKRRQTLAISDVLNLHNTSTTSAKRRQTLVIRVKPSLYSKSQKPENAVAIKRKASSFTKNEFGSSKKVALTLKGTDTPVKHPNDSKLKRRLSVPSFLTTHGDTSTERNSKIRRSMHIGVLSVKPLGGSSIRNSSKIRRSKERKTETTGENKGLLQPSDEDVGKTVCNLQHNSEEEAKELTQSGAHTTDKVPPIEKKNLRQDPKKNRTSEFPLAPEQKKLKRPHKDIHATQLPSSFPLSSEKGLRHIESGTHVTQSSSFLLTSSSSKSTHSEEHDATSEYDGAETEKQVEDSQTKCKNFSRRGAARGTHFTRSSLPSLSFPSKRTHSEANGATAERDTTDIDKQAEDSKTKSKSRRVAVTRTYVTRPSSSSSSSSSMSSYSPSKSAHNEAEAAASENDAAETETKYKRSGAVTRIHITGSSLSPSASLLSVSSPSKSGKGDASGATSQSDGTATETKQMSRTGAVTRTHLAQSSLFSLSGSPLSLSSVSKSNQSEVNGSTSEHDGPATETKYKLRSGRGGSSTVSRTLVTRSFLSPSSSPLSRPSRSRSAQSEAKRGSRRGAVTTTHVTRALLFPSSLSRMALLSSSKSAHNEANSVTSGNDATVIEPKYKRAGRAEVTKTHCSRFSRFTSANGQASGATSQPDGNAIATKRRLRRGAVTKTHVSRSSLSRYSTSKSTHSDTHGATSAKDGSAILTKARGRLRKGAVTRTHVTQSSLSPSSSPLLLHSPSKSGRSEVYGATSEYDGSAILREYKGKLRRGAATRAYVTGSSLPSSSLSPLSLSSPPKSTRSEAYGATSENDDSATSTEHERELRRGAVTRTHVTRSSLSPPSSSSTPLSLHSVSKSTCSGAYGATSERDGSAVLTEYKNKLQRGAATRAYVTQSSLSSSSLSPLSLSSPSNSTRSEAYGATSENDGSTILTEHKRRLRTGAVTRTSVTRSSSSPSLPHLLLYSPSKSTRSEAYGTSIQNDGSAILTEYRRKLRRGAVTRSHVIRSSMSPSLLSPLSLYSPSKSTQSEACGTTSDQDGSVILTEYMRRLRRGAATKTDVAQSSLSPSSSPPMSLSSTSTSSHCEGNDAASDPDGTATEKKYKRRSRKDAADSSVPPEMLKFTRRRVVQLQSETTSPWRLKFRRGRLLGDNKTDGVHMFGDSNDVQGESKKVVLRHNNVEEKKDIQSLLNNVIEETASKLVEAKKSKVKALVGAFESVMK